MFDRDRSAAGIPLRYIARVYGRVALGTAPGHRQSADVRVWPGRGFLRDTSLAASGARAPVSSPSRGDLASPAPLGQE
jgi:hypothetical protein